MANSSGSDDMLNRVMPRDNIGLAALLKTNETAWENCKLTTSGVVFIYILYMDLYKYKYIIYVVYNISFVGLQSIEYIETYSHVHTHIYIYLYIINTSTDAPVIYTYIIYVCE